MNKFDIKMNILWCARQIKNKVQLINGKINKKNMGDCVNKKKIFYMLVPIHGNLGDQAIAYASIKYLKEYFMDYEIIEVESKDTYKYISWIKKIIKDEDIIILHGGGNMGTHYISEEEKRRYIVKSFPKNKIISFTQTIFFEENSYGKKELDKSSKSYNSHKNLTILAREDRSYDFMKLHFKNCRIIKCPDIVFYLNNKVNNNGLNRKTITTLLRKDKETYIDIDTKKEFIEKLKDEYDDVKITDTLLNINVNKYERESELYKLWKIIQESEVVITDRLHGMIFCAITKTPCIVTRSLDHKVIESYKWINNLNHIKLVDDLDFREIKILIEEFRDLKNIEEFNFDEIYFKKLNLKNN